MPFLSSRGGGSVKGFGRNRSTIISNGTITGVSSTQNSVTFTINNPNPYRVRAFYGTGSILFNSNNVIIQGNSSEQVTVSGLSAGTNYTLYSVLTDAKNFFTRTTVTQSASTGIAALYSFTTHTFTNATATGRNGPTLAQCRTAYNSSSWTQNSLFFDVVSGIQYWTVPEDGIYQIEAAGAQGEGTSPGLGARMRGNFSLTKGEIIRILIGQIPAGSAGTNAGGGGGSFVVKSPYNNNDSILVIAGGGGGSRSTVSNRHGNTSTSGGSGSGSFTTLGGTDGNGGAVNNANQGPGGGFFTNGAGGAANAGIAFINGGQGGNDAISGGFGGGGGTISSSAERMAGGGGYSGGGTARTNTSAAAGGGGSYNSGANPSNSAGVNSGNGYVIITRL
jgi:hypothetical protein